MAAKPPVILVNGEFRQMQAGDQLLDPLDNSPINQTIVKANGEATALVVGDICYDSGSGAVKKARADATLTCSGILWVSLQTPSGGGGSGLFRPFGSVANLSGLTTNLTYYLSPTTAGAMTTTVPTTAGHYIIKLGVAQSTTSFFFKIERPILLS